MKNKSKILPNSIEAEHSVLGGILLENDVLNKISEILKPEDFYLDAHQRIYRAILALREENAPLDIITLTDYFLKRKELELVGGAAYLSRLLDNVASSANIVHHANIIKEKSILRKLLSVTGEIYNQCFEPVEDLEEFLDTTEEKIFAITQKERSKFNIFDIKQIMKSSLNIIDELYHKKEYITGVTTGFKDLDNLTAGLQPSDLIIIAGRPGMGKTALALSILKSAALDGNPCAFFSLEMSKEQIGMRLLCAEAKVELQKIRRGFISDKDWTPLANAAAKLSETKIFIDDTAGLNIMELRSRARKLKAEHDIKLLIIDYLQLMRAHKSKDSREQEIAEISRSLKALAKELNIPIVALSQLNRAVETKGEDKRPQMANLRESGAIEQDADVIIFVYREEYYLRQRGKDIPDDVKNVAEIIVAKQRNGPTGIVKVYFNDKITFFGDLLHTVA